MIDKTMIDWKQIMIDYEPADADDDIIRNIKLAIMTLPPQAKKIFLTYVELGSYAAVASEYNVSAPTAKVYVDDVINKIKASI